MEHSMQYREDKKAQEKEERRKRIKELNEPPRLTLVEDCLLYTSMYARN